MFGIRNARSSKAMTRSATSTPPGPGPVARQLWAGFGAALLGAGAPGLILPLLPTTPFMILAAFAFSQGTPDLGRALRVHRVFGPCIAEWRAGGAIAPRQKARALAMMGAALATGVVFAFGTVLIVLHAMAMSAAFIPSRPNRAA